jgi:hypothetical protein
MKAKSGRKIEAVKPVDPEEVFEADEAVPGKVAELKSAQYASQSGKYGQTKLPAHKPASAEKGGSGDGGGQSSSGPSQTASSAKEPDSASPAASAKSSKPEADSQDDDKKSWISIKLTDEDGNAVAGQKYEVILPDGTLAKGTLGTGGTAKVKDFVPGACKVSFPGLVDGSVSEKG